MLKYFIEVGCYVTFVESVTLQILLNVLSRTVSNVFCKVFMMTGYELFKKICTYVLNCMHNLNRLNNELTIFVIIVLHEIEPRKK